jgi:hypothetical protein
VSVLEHTGRFMPLATSLKNSFFRAFFSNIQEATT